MDKRVPGFRMATAELAETPGSSLRPTFLDIRALNEAYACLPACEAGDWALWRANGGC